MWHKERNIQVSPFDSTHHCITIEGHQKRQPWKKLPLWAGRLEEQKGCWFCTGKSLGYLHNRTFKTELYCMNDREQNPTPVFREAGLWMSWVTDPQGRVVWSDQDLTLMLEPVEQTQRGCWATKDPDSPWCHLGATLVQPQDVHSPPQKPPLLCLSGCHLPEDISRKVFGSKYL